MEGDHVDPREWSLTEVVAAALGIISVGAIVWLSLDGDQSARTALTGLVGAASSYFLTPKIARNGKSNGTNGTPSV